MSRSEKMYVILCVIFTAVLMLGNMTYQKFASIPCFIHTFELSVGAILYPVTFVISDLITEFYGKDRAKFCVRLALMANVMAVTIISIMDHLPATSWSKVSDGMFHEVFGYYGVAFIGSLVACYVAQNVDIFIYAFIRRLTKGKYIWLRSNISTGVSLLIDTSLVIGFLSLFNVLPKANLLQLIINSYSWKLFFTVAITPIFYLSALYIKRYAFAASRQDSAFAPGPA